MTTLGTIKALRKANKSQHRLIKKLNARNAGLEEVVEAAKKWSDAEARWQAHLSHCDKCQRHEMCSEEWLDNSFAVIEAWKDTLNALSKLSESEVEK